MGDQMEMINLDQGMKDRVYWITTMIRIVSPVLNASSASTLKRTMPVAGLRESRLLRSHLEALGRSLAGIAPWLESPPGNAEEEALRKQYAAMAREALDAATDPESPDYLNYSEGWQTIVDSAFLVQALLRAPVELWEKLDERVKRNLVREIRSAQKGKRPDYNNWLLFAALVEAWFFKVGEAWDPMRVDYALKQHEQWYAGDGHYNDGTFFHADYYNSFVIQPMMMEILDIVGEQFPDWEALKESMLPRAQRYAVVQERMISPEGTFPPIGRSLAYRFGAFQHLSLMALRQSLPDELLPAQVRCALTAVIRRMAEAPGMFDEDGWLQLGFCGYQPSAAEPYISTGSLYLCSSVFVALGLPANDPFWQGEKAWTSLKAWSGQPFPLDGTIRDQVMYR